MAQLPVGGEGRGREGDRGKVGGEKRGGGRGRVSHVLTDPFLFSSVRTLGMSEGKGRKDVDDAASWISKMRKIDDEKKKAAKKVSFFSLLFCCMHFYVLFSCFNCIVVVVVDDVFQAQMLAEMDEEFGIADLMSEVVKEDRNKVRS